MGQAFVKSRKDFKTVAILSPVASEIVIESIYYNTSTVTVLGEITVDLGDFLIYDGWIGVISQAAIDGGLTSLTLSSFLSVFDRKLIYEEFAGSIESFVKGTIEANFINVSDPDYAMPFITVRVPETSTAFISPDVEDRLFSLRSYIAKIRRVKKVFLSVEYTNTGIVLTVEQKNPQTHFISFSMSAYQLSAEDYSDKSISKITAVTSDSSTDYYLLEDGSITTEQTEDRRKGQWISVFINDPEKVTDVVTDEFAKNSHSHSLEFYSKKDLQFYDNLKIQVNNSVLQSYVSQIIKTSNDSRYLIKSGELKVTFAEKQLEVV